MPRHDDTGIPGDAVLIRAVQPDWIEAETERLKSPTFLDGEQEASCFVSHEVGGTPGFCENILPVLSRLLGFDIRTLALISVFDVRRAGLWIYRKPEEFHDNAAHVVICPPDGISKSQYVKRAKALAPLAIKTSVPIEN